MEEADYTPEQHLVAAVGEFKKLEGNNQSYIERMYKTLSSPFKISTKPCEANRLEVLRCYEEIFRATKPDGGEASSAAHSSSGDAPSPAVTLDGLWQMPLHNCHAAAKLYEQCVEKRTLAEHLALASSFESKRIAAQARAVEEMNASRRAGAAVDAAAAAATAAEQRAE